jgi:hypothetical protein
VKHRADEEVGVRWNLERAATHAASCHWYAPTDDVARPMGMATSDR